MSAIIRALATLTRVSHDADGLPESRREDLRDQALAAKAEYDQLRRATCTPAERAVLDVIRSMRPDVLRAIRDLGGDGTRLYDAELARRDAGTGPGC